MTNNGDVKIINCNCKHAYQDEKHGKGKRVANETDKGTFRCTVCETERI